MLYVRDVTGRCDATATPPHGRSFTATRRFSHHRHSADGGAEPGPPFEATAGAATTILSFTFSGPAPRGGAPGDTVTVSPARSTRRVRLATLWGMVYEWCMD